MQVSQNTLLLLSRSGKGIGGMQRLSQDLERGFHQWKDVRLISYRAQSILGLIILPCVALFQLFTLPRQSRVHFCDASLSPLGALISMFRPDLHLSLTACGLDVIYPAWWYQKLLQFSLKRIDRIACISHATMDALVERGYPAQHCAVIPCGVWPVEQPLELLKREGGPLLLFVGRLVPRKGAAWFVEEVLPLLLGEYPNVKFTIVGEGEDKNLITKIIQQKHLESVAFLMGQLSDAERNTLFARADVLVVPNVPIAGDMEGFGIVCIEASARGVPVVAARLEGLQDAVVESETGYFFESLNARGCADKIISLLQKPLSSEEVQRKTQEHYGWGKLLPRYRHDVFGS